MEIKQIKRLDLSMQRNIQNRLCFSNSAKLMLTSTINQVGQTAVLLSTFCFHSLLLPIKLVHMLSILGERKIMVRPLKQRTLPKDDIYHSS